MRREEPGPPADRAAVLGLPPPLPVKPEPGASCAGDACARRGEVADRGVGRARAWDGGGSKAWGAVVV